jgi:hypothetical protein
MDLSLRKSVGKGEEKGTSTRKDYAIAWSTVNFAVVESEHEEGKARRENERLRALSTHGLAGS